MGGVENRVLARGRHTSYAARLRAADVPLAADVLPHPNAGRLGRVGE